MNKITTITIIIIIIINLIINLMITYMQVLAFGQSHG